MSPSGEVIELEYTEKEYKHYNFFGTISEDEVLYTKTNRKRFGQAVVDEEEPEEEESQKPQPKENGQGHIWTDEDTERLKALIESGEELRVALKGYRPWRAIGYRRGAQ